jgi:fructose-bisphosphate aldolase class I
MAARHRAGPTGPGRTGTAGPGHAAGAGARYHALPATAQEHRTVSINQEQKDRIASGQGFIAALDQSGGSTPKALKLYGIEESAYSGDAEMFALVHAMRSRIVTSPAFGERVLGAILFERTLDDSFDGQEAARYLWEAKRVVPFLKIDKGLEDEADGVQRLKPIPGLAELLARAKAKGVFGTKERSVIKANNAAGIVSVLDQQFELGQQVLDAGLVPIIEPEVDIKAPDKAAIEVELKKGLLARLDKVDPATPVILKLTLPSVDGFFQELVDHPSVLKVVALSGGYSRDDANAKLAKNPGVIASFSRALTEGLSAQQSDDAFNQALDATVESIYRASIA